MILVTAFVAKQGEGPAVTAQRQGNTWTFSWKGRRGSDSGNLIGIDLATAEKVALGVAERIAGLEPLWAEVEDRQDEIGRWLDSQRKPE